MTTTTPLPPVKDLAAALVDRDPSYGAPVSVPLPDGQSLRLSIEPDETDPLEDMGEGFWTGPVAWVERDRWTGRDAPRPDGFDGRARKLQVGNGDAVWWQVPDDVPAESVGPMGDAIRDILEYGYSGYVLELRETVTDSTGGAHVVTVDTASLWGIEPFPDDSYLAEVVADLIREILP